MAKYSESALDERCCSLCGSHSLDDYCIYPDRMGRESLVMQCRECLCFVPDYFEVWKNTKGVQSQIEFHQRCQPWDQCRSAPPRSSMAETKNEELDSLVVDLVLMVQDYAKEIGNPTDDNLVVEIGCGRGGLLKALLEAGYRAIGCEPAPELIAIGRGHYGLGPDVLLQQDAAHFLEYLEAHQLRPRTVVLWHVLEHVEAPLELLSAIKYACDPGGFAVLQLPLLASDYVYPEHYFFPTRGTIEYIARYCDFRIQRYDIDPFLNFVSVVFALGGGNSEACRARPATVSDLLRARGEGMIVRDRAVSLKNEIIAGQVRLDKERLEAIASQAKLVEERWEAMQEMGKMIQDRDATVAAQGEMLEQRWNAMQKMEAMIGQRDATMAAQTRAIEEQNGVIRSLQQLLADSAAEDRLQALRRQSDLLAFSEKAGDDLRGRLEAAAALAEERYAAIQQQSKMIDERNAAIGELLQQLAAAAALAKKGYAAIQEQSRVIDERNVLIRELRRHLAADRPAANDKCEAVKRSTH